MKIFNEKMVTYNGEPSMEDIISKFDYLIRGRRVIDTWVREEKMDSAALVHYSPSARFYRVSITVAD